MSAASKRATLSNTLTPCQKCDQLKDRFYQCARGHITCEDCKTTPKTEEDSRSTPCSSVDTGSPFTKLLLHICSFFIFFEFFRRIFRRKTLSTSTSRLSDGDLSKESKIFCRACDRSVDALLVILPTEMLRSLLEQREVLDAVPDEIHHANVETVDGHTLKEMVQILRQGLAMAFADLELTRQSFDALLSAAEKLEMDVDMLRGGVNFVYFNFHTVLDRGSVRVTEKICGIPFELMVRMRSSGAVPYLGFLIRLEEREGRAHSPLRKCIVLRAHSNDGKVIVKESFRTSKDGVNVYSCFDLTRPGQDTWFGFQYFMRKDRILKPDILKNGRLCLSVQIKPS